MTIPSAGFQNYMTLIHNRNKTESPEDIATIAACNKATKAAHALRKLNADKKSPDLRKEYNRLRQELFGFQQWAKNTEIYLGTQAGLVNQLTERIESLLRLKKKAATEGNLGQERTLEHQIVSCEAELVDAKVEFTRATHQSTNAAQALKGFTGYEQIKELKKQLAL